MKYLDARDQVNIVIERALIVVTICQKNESVDRRRNLEDILSDLGAIDE